MKQKNIMLDVEKLNQKLVKLNICAIFLYLEEILAICLGKMENENKTIYLRVAFLFTNYYSPKVSF